VSKPIVDGLEKDLRGQATVLRIDLLSGIGRDAARLYDVKVVPTTLLFDGNGNVILRETGMPSAGKFRAAVADLVVAP